MLFARASACRTSAGFGCERARGESSVTDAAAFARALSAAARQASCCFATPACTISAPTHIATSAGTRAGSIVCTSVLLPLHLIFADSSSAFCSSSSRAALTWFLCSCQAPFDVLARLRETVVDRDPFGADVGDRRLGLLARVPRLRRGRRLQPLEVGVPAAELVLDGGRERRPVVGDVCDHRVLGDGEPRLQLPELLVDARRARSRGAATTDASSRCSASRWRRMRGLVRDERRSARVPAAGRSGGGPPRAGRRSWSCSCSSLLLVCPLTRRRLAGADANALPGAAALLPAHVSAVSGARLGDLGEPALGRRRRVAGERDEEALARLVRPLRPSTTRGPRGTGDRLRPRFRTPRRSARAGHAPGPRPSVAWAASAVASACRSSSSAWCRSPLGERDRSERRRERTPRGRRTRFARRARTRAGTHPPRPRPPRVSRPPTLRAAAPGARNASYPTASA